MRRPKAFAPRPNERPRGPYTGATMEERTVARHLAGAELWARAAGWSPAMSPARGRRKARRPGRTDRTRDRQRRHPDLARCRSGLGLGGRRAVLRHHLLHGRGPAVLPALPRRAGGPGPRHWPRSPRTLPRRRQAAGLSRAARLAHDGRDPASGAAQPTRRGRRVGPDARHARGSPPGRPAGAAAQRQGGPGRGPSAARPGAPVRMADPAAHPRLGPAPDRDRRAGADGGHERGVLRAVPGVPAPAPRTGAEPAAAGPAGPPDPAGQRPRTGQDRPPDPRHRRPIDGQRLPIPRRRAGIRSRAPGRIGRRLSRIRLGPPRDGDQGSAGRAEPI